MCFPSSKQILKVSLHQAIEIQHFESGWNRGWCAVEGLCTAFEAQKRTHTDIYFTLLDAASIAPDIVVNSLAKGKERGAWIPFKI